MMVSRRLPDLPLLVVLMGVASVCMLVPAAHAVVLGQSAVARAFFYSAIVLVVLTTMIGIAVAAPQGSVPAPRKLVSVIGTYLALPLVMAVPVHQAVPDVTFGQAWFEMLSAFTTTGATIFDTPGAAAPPIHLWRAMSGWLGGFYSLLIAVAILAPMGLGGVELMGGRAPGRGGGTVQISKIAETSQRVTYFTAVVLPVYVGLTVLLWTALLIAGDSALIGLCHAMGTISSSGISPITGLGGAASGLFGEILIFLCFGFALTRRLWPGAITTDRSATLWGDPELRLAVGIVATVTAVLCLYQTSQFAYSGGPQSIGASLRSLWGTAFTALSFLTTTGYTSSVWPGFGAPSLFLLGLAILGGGVATTAGGIKLLRVYALLRHSERELERVVHPHSIGGHGAVARRLRRQGAYLAWIFFMVFGISIAATTAAMTLTGLEFWQSMVLAVAGLTNTGPLAAAISETQMSYSALGSSQMAVLGLAMIFGRVEILAVFVVFARESWAR